MGLTRKEPSSRSRRTHSDDRFATSRLGRSLTPPSPTLSTASVESSHYCGILLGEFGPGEQHRKQGAIQTLPACSYVGSVRRGAADKSDQRHHRLLGARGEWTSGRAAENGNELAAFQMIG
jgi:hypothetical protein